MRRLVLFLVVAVSMAVLPSVVLAQSGDEERDDFTLRINGDYVVPAGETLGTLLVIRGDVEVHGTVDEALVVINGDAVVTGTGRVNGETTVVSGTLDLRSGSEVQDVTLISSDLERASGAMVLGDIDRTRGGVWWGWGAAVILGFVFWLGMTIAVLVAGVLFALVGGRQLAGAASYMSERVGGSVLTGFIMLLAVPIVGIALLVTIIGIPLGIGVLFFLGPALLFFGYLVAGTWLGSLVLSRAPEAIRERPVLPALVGLGILQLIVLVPGLGWVIFPLGGLWGMGALVYYAVTSMRKREEPVAVPAA